MANFLWDTTVKFVEFKVEARKESEVSYMRRE